MTLCLHLKHITKGTDHKFTGFTTQKEEYRHGTGEVCVLGVHDGPERLAKEI